MFALALIGIEQLIEAIGNHRFLIALLWRHELPELLVKFFYKFLQSAQANNLSLKYYNQAKYLEDRSVVELYNTGNTNSSS